MNQHYTYDNLYGTLLYKNTQDTERGYFIIECDYYKFYRWMFQHGWNLVDKKKCERNGIRGYKATLKTNIIKEDTWELFYTLQDALSAKF